ncbi:hypothetical protein [Reichenbachiella versicolor]|uniref:hypothetical protein n=1 Tax=Reichenbachiella versicolor TaxID=1821036 RepID=UPI000D6E48FC|nr:hypothetical protein [Reichenbachiella versicolor]
MKSTLALLIIMTASAVGYTQQLRIKHTSEGQAYVESEAMKIENDNDLVMENGQSVHEISFAYYGSSAGDKSMRMTVSFTESVKREIPAGSMVIIKLGNGEIVGSRTLASYSGVRRDDNVYASNFYVYFNNTTARKIAASGIKKVRLAYEKKRFDWQADENKSKTLAMGVFNTDLNVFAK